MFDRLIPIMFIFVASMFFFRDIEALFLVSLIVLTVYTLHDGRLCFDIGDILLVLGTFSYHLFAGQEIDEAIYNSVLYLVIYQLGKKLVTVGEYPSVQKAAWISVLIGLATMIKGILHYSVRPEGVTEEWVGWGQTGTTPRTQFEMYLVIMAALLGYFLILIIRFRLLPGLIGAIMSLVCVYLGVNSEGRLALGCCLSGTVVVIVLSFIETGAYKKVFGKIAVFALLVIGVLLAAVYKLDLFGYRTMFDNSFMAGSGGFFTNTRFSLMLQQIKLFRYYPMGNCDVPLVEYDGINRYYAHNFWLDIGREGGVIPAILYAAFSVTNIISLLRVSFRSQDINKYATFAAFIGAMVYAGLECVVGMNVLRCSIVLMGGLLKGITYDIYGIRGEDSFKSFVSFSI